MRAPITVSHEKIGFDVIFRRRGGIQNWSIEVDAETPQDAEREARLILAHDRYKSREDMADWPESRRVTRDHDWVVAEINRVS